MKIRLGFVTNSSSTSFMILSVGNKDVSKILNSVREDKHLPDEYSDADILEGLASDFYVEIGEGGARYGQLYLGWDPTKVLQDMSIKQASVALAAAIKERFNVDIDPDKVGLECEGWYEG